MNDTSTKKIVINLLLFIALYFLSVNLIVTPEGLSFLEKSAFSKAYNEKSIDEGGLSLKTYINMFYISFIIIYLFFSKHSKKVFVFLVLFTIFKYIFDYVVISKVFGGVSIKYWVIVLFLIVASINYSNLFPKHEAVLIEEE